MLWQGQCNMFNVPKSGDSNAVCLSEQIRSRTAWHLRAFQWIQNFMQKCETLANYVCFGLNEEIRFDIIAMLWNYRRNEYVFSVMIKLPVVYLKPVRCSIHSQDKKYFISSSFWNLAQVCVVQPKAFLLLCPVIYFPVKSVAQVSTYRWVDWAKQAGVSSFCGNGLYTKRSLTAEMRKAGVQQEIC